MNQSLPPGAPGTEPRWASSRKCGVGTAVDGCSPVWFAIAHGILNEIYYPRPDYPNTRDAGFLVAADNGFFSEEKCATHHEISLLEQGVPAYRLTNTCEDGRYRITKIIFTDPDRPGVLMKVKFEALKQKLGHYRLFFLIAPHMANRGADNDAWTGDFKGEPLLYAGRKSIAMAVACSAGWKARSCGYVGTSDGWQQVRAHGRLQHEYVEARHGNVALTGEIDLPACGGEFRIVIGFGGGPAEAGHVARAGLLADFDQKQRTYVEGWKNFQKECLPLSAPTHAGFDLYRSSTAMLRTHESKSFRGGVVASLSTPWGAQHGDGDVGGYHMVWPRDQTHVAMALLAVGRTDQAREILFYLLCTQNSEGNWPQNMWVSGEARKSVNQSDQTGSAILLAAALRRLPGGGTIDAWEGVRRAAEYLLRKGPVTDEDRWEENRGYTSYTLAITIAALLAAAEFADEHHAADLARRCRQSADSWNNSIENWLYVTDTDMARQANVEGYYVRLAPAETKCPDDLRRLRVQVHYYDPPEKGKFAAADMVSPDALAFVRYGLRRPDDPRVENTVKVIDATLRQMTKSGPVWRRFNHDSYGEGEDGAPFVKTGIGRGWPVLTGERAHYELARGNHAAAKKLLGAMAAQSHAGLFPEQIWDANDLPKKGLYNGGPSGSAAPLVWAHAEFVTLLRSLREGKVFDCPPETVARYCS